MVKNKLNAHFVVRRNVIFERAKFNQRQQEQGETVDSFITSLHCLSEHCGYGPLHDEMVRDRLVVGLRDKKLSEQLQLDSELTLEKAVTRARQSEQVKNQQNLLKSNFKSSATDVDSIQTKFSHRALNEANTTGSDEEEIAFLGTVSSEGEPWLITLKVNEDTAVFKIDTGADVTVLSEEIFQKGQFPQLESTKKVLQGPGRTPITVRGKFTASIRTDNKSTTQEVYVVPELKCNLLGRPAIQALGLVASVDTVALDSRERVKEQFPKLFKGLGKMEGDYKIELRADAKPFSISTPRRIPLPLMPQVKKELSRMEDICVISRVEQPTDWCTGMVPVPKPGKNEVRICVDLTKLNESVKRERHMLPSVEHTLGQLEGAKVFSKIDANSGFWQIPLAKDSALLTTFLTPFGRLCFNRLCFGISSAPEQYQKRMSRILEGLDGVLCQMDNVLVFGDTQAQHDTRLSVVLERLQEAGVTLRSEKCEFSKRHVKFLGQIIDAAGVRADPDKVRAVTDMKEPEDVSGVRRFLGMVNHLGIYLPNLAEKTQSLRDLLKKQNTFQWGHQQQRAFTDIKKELSSPPGLALYNSKAEAVVSADASSFGLGAVLLQKQGEGYLKPVAYSSRALTETEKRYAQIEKEALAITWACEWFSDYLVGIRFHVETDHKPLVPLLGSKSLDELPPRIQRLRMRLLAFCYSISHVAGKELATADVLSRAPLRESEQPKQEEKIKLYVNMVMSTLPATEKRLQEIRKCQKGDEILSQVKSLQHGGDLHTQHPAPDTPRAMERQKGLCGPLKGSSRKKKTLIWPSWLTGPPRSPTGIAQLSCQWADSSGQRFQSSLNTGWTDIVKLKEEEQKLRQRSRVHFNKRHRAQQLTTLTPDNHVWIKDTKEKGTVISQANTPRSYVIDSPRGILRRNCNHLVTTLVPPAEQTTSPEPDLPADQPVSPARAEQIPVQPGSPMTRACYPARERQPPGSSSLRLAEFELRTVIRTKLHSFSLFLNKL
ncbi:hypothetical protein NFI96_004001 [Prochilodus magdalenae]|nr:hypothetical protein NFI96_004001 [Prochilodus magdalenae]